MSGFVLLNNDQEIPQWKQCYYDWKFMEKMLDFMNNIHSVITNLDLKKLIQRHNRILNKKAHIAKNPQVSQLMNETLNNLNQNTLKQINIIALSQQDKEIQDQLNNILTEWKIVFVKFFYNQHKLTYAFAHYKTFQINQKQKQYQFMLASVRHLRQYRNKVIILYQNLYIDSYYLQNAIQYNIMHQNYISKKLQSTLYDNQLSNLLKFSNKSKRLMIQNYKKLEKIQLYCTKYHHELKESSYSDLKQRSRDIFRINYNQIMIVGLAMGAVAYLVAIILLNRAKIQNSAQGNDIFSQHFRAWRGASYFLLYMWILGGVVLLYEKAKINYTLIFHTGAHDLPHSKFLLLRASIFSLIYFVLFVLFCSQLNGQINRGFYWYAECFWALIIIYFIFPFSILQRGNRLNFPKALINVICSPCIPVTFMMVWITQQFASHTQPFGDFIYTACYTARRQRKQCDDLSLYFKHAFVFIILVYRIIQCLKIFFTIFRNEQKYNFLNGNFLGFLGCSFSIISTIFAIFYSYRLFMGSFQVWIVIASLTTVYCWLADLKGNWGLLQFQNKKCLREKLLFPQAKPLYIFFMILNLALRAAWVLTISPVISDSQGIRAQLFVMMFSYLQIFRRGVWNFLVVENIHMNNCKEYQATIRNTELINSIKQVVRDQNILRRQKQWINDRQASNTRDDSKEQQVLQIAQKRLVEQKILFQNRLKTRQQLKHQIKILKQILQRKLQDVQKIIELRFPQSQLKI